jgi:hypothetical protein
MVEAISVLLSLRAALDQAVEALEPPGPRRPGPPAARRRPGEAARLSGRSLAQRHRTDLRAASGKPAPNVAPPSTDQIAQCRHCGGQPGCPKQAESPRKRQLAGHCPSAITIMALCISTHCRAPLDCRR